MTREDTIDEIVRVSQRKDSFPLRREFLQHTDAARIRSSGPLASLVSAGDQRGLILYLLLVTKVSASPWDAALPSPVWARALGHPLPNSKAARTMVSKTWLRLERHQLVARRRKGRLADVFLLQEDGSGEAYTAPGSDVRSYFRVPLELWTSGPGEGRWFAQLSLPEMAVLLIGRSLGDEFLLPQEKGPQWYGVSPDTIARGTAGLMSRGLLRRDTTFKAAPLSAVGYTEENRYTLLAPFGPLGHLSGSGKRNDLEVLL